MAISICDNCGNVYSWSWEEAFDKFGFGDGDGQVETWRVCRALERAGYIVEAMTWSLHNTIIYSIRKDGIEQIAESVAIGYDDPRTYLPSEIVSLLDYQFPAGAAS